MIMKKSKVFQERETKDWTFDAKSPSGAYRIKLFWFSTEEYYYW